MYLAIDIGGTKTLLVTLDDKGVIKERYKFETPKDYQDFIKVLANQIKELSDGKFTACGVGVPGRINREDGVAIALGNLGWANAPLKHDITDIVQCPVIMDNDANLAGLSEALLVKNKYNHVLYITISTGIGTGVIINQTIAPSLADSEGGHLLLEHDGILQEWEDFAAGSAIVRRYGKKAQDITDEATWKLIARDLSVGIMDLIAVIQPQIIIVGGSVGNYFERLESPLMEILKTYEMPLVPIPPIIKAHRPDDAVIYGCYELAKKTYAKTNK